MEEQATGENTRPWHQVEDRAASRALRLLEMEYERLQGTVDRFDGQRFQVKNWTVTTSGALLALGASTESPQIVLAGILPICFFAFLEIIYVDMQSKVIVRSNAVESLIEELMREEVTELPQDYRFGLGQVFESGFKLKRLPGLVTRRPHLSVFYLGLVAAMGLSALLISVY